MTPRGIVTSIWAFAVALLLAGSPSLASYRDLIGYPDLLLEPDVPTGTGVLVTHVEALFENGYMPDTIPPNHPEFSGKTFIDASGSSPTSSHARQVGQNFYGNSTSIAPDILEITNFELDDWLDDGFLKRTSEAKPDWSTSRIANHSWAKDIGSGNSAVLLRLDFVVETDDYIQVIGVSNEPEVQPLLADSYNAIAVGLTNAVHAKGTTSVDSIYVSGRTKPDLVAPGFSPSYPTVKTSWAAPMVAASAALLIETSQDNPGLSNGSYSSPRSGATIYHAETSEVIKAALMAGADRRTHNFRGAEISDYAVDTSNGLDNRFGAGQVNIFNSYKIISGGEHNSLEDGDDTDIGQYGFDYDPAFGGDSESNSVASYFFDAAGNDFLITCLAWNLDIAGGPGPNFNDTATFYDLDLLLYDVTSGTSLVGSSASSNDNTENLYKRLTIGHRYKLEVSPGDEQGYFLWDYGLAWQLAVLPGDVNGDGWVSDADLSIVIAHWGQSGLGPEYGDLNGNGIVDGPDYSEVISYWDTGVQPPSEASEAIAAMPEPATVWLMILVGAVLARRKRKQ